MLVLKFQLSYDLYSSQGILHIWDIYRLYFSAEWFAKKTCLWIYFVQGINWQLHSHSHSPMANSAYVI